MSSGLWGASVSREESEGDEGKGGKEGQGERGVVRKGKGREERERDTYT